MIITTATSPTTDQLVPFRRAGGAALLLGGLSFIAGGLVLPGPDAADVHRFGWAAGHLLSAVAFLLLGIGLPAVAVALGRRLGVLGAVGYLALVIRCVLSTGSHLYSWWTVPKLVDEPALHAQLVDDGPLMSIYAGYGDAINAAIAIGLLCLAIALWRLGSGFRAAAVLALCAAVGEALSNPLGLLALAVLGIWLGLPLTLRGRVGVALRG